MIDLTYGRVPYPPGVGGSQPCFSSDLPSPPRLEPDEHDRRDTGRDRPVCIPRSVRKLSITRRAPGRAPHAVSGWPNKASLPRRFALRRLASMRGWLFARSE